MPRTLAPSASSGDRACVEGACAKMYMYMHMDDFANLKLNSNLDVQLEVCSRPC